MQVYKVFFQILNKQKGQIIMYMCIFCSIAAAVVAANAGGSRENFESVSCKFSVFDEDRSVVSSNLISYLSIGNERVEVEDNEEAIQDKLYNRMTSCVLRIPKGFGESVSGSGDVGKIEIVGIPGTMASENFQSLITQYITLLRGYIAGGYSVESAVRRVDMASLEQVQAVVSDDSAASSEQHSPMYYYFSYVPYILTAICVVAIGPALMIFHRREVKERNLCSAYTLSRMNREQFLGTITAGVGLCVIFFIEIVIGTKGAALSLHGVLHLINMFCFLLVALGITFCAGQMLKNASTLSMVSNIVGLGMSFLGGVFVPLEYLGEGVIRVAHFLPSYWYIIATRGIDRYSSGRSLSEVWMAMGIEILFAAGLVAAGVIYSRVKAQKA